MQFEAISYNLPANPSRYRVATWKKLRELGAVYLQDGVAMVPAQAGMHSSLEELRQKLDAKAVEFQKKEYDFPTLADALESYAAEAAAWAYDTVPGMVQRARKEGYRDVAKQLRIIGEVEGGHADLARGAAQGQVDREHEVSLCPTCGAVYFGRRPAFCTICNQPNFEMERMRRGVLD